jgi:hypothetical protein
MVEAARNAPLVPQYYASVAAKMMLAAAARNGAYRAVFRDVFVGRLILSFESAAAILSSAIPEEETGFAAKAERHNYTPKVSPLPSDHYGLTQTLYVELPADPAETIARSATRNGRSITPLSAEDAARNFVDRLFIMGLIDYGDFGDKDHRGSRYRNDSSPIQSTHRIELVGEQLRLRRIRIH